MLWLSEVSVASIEQVVGKHLEYKETQRGVDKQEDRNDEHAVKQRERGRRGNNVSEALLGAEIFRPNNERPETPRCLEESKIAVPGRSLGRIIVRYTCSRDAPDCVRYQDDGWNLPDALSAPAKKMTATHMQ
jgi:hypothetical protein